MRERGEWQGLYGTSCGWYERSLIYEAQWRSGLLLKRNTTDVWRVSRSDVYLLLDMNYGWWRDVCLHLCRLSSERFNIIVVQTSSRRNGVCIKARHRDRCMCL